MIPIYVEFRLRNEDHKFQVFFYMKILNFYTYESKQGNLHISIYKFWFLQKFQVYFFIQT